MNKMIGGSVGLNGKNHLQDVKRIQILLNRHYANTGGANQQTPLKVDGKCGQKTISAIQNYQKTVMRIHKPDSRVDPGYPTFLKLNLNWYHKNDEACKILDFIIGEIKTNVAGEPVRRMKEYNLFKISKCIAEWKKEPLLTRILMSLDRRGPGGCTDELLQSKSMALILWAEKVRVEGDWDHKPIIANRFTYRVQSHQTQERHILGDYTYYYDIWSNIHFGYVGMAAGFTESELLDGAGAEQFVATLFKGSLPQKTSPGMRGWDDGPDRDSVRIGIELHKKNPNNITARDVLEKIRKAGGRLERRAYYPF